MTRAHVIINGHTILERESSWLTPRELGERLVREYERSGRMAVVEAREVPDDA